MATKPVQLENHALRRLAHLMAGVENENTLNTAHDFIVEQALLDGGKAKSQKDIRQSIAGVFLLRFSGDEIIASITRLRAEGRVKESGGRYTLEIKREEQLKKLNAETKAQEKKIYSDWREDITRKYPDLTDGDKDLLVEDLRQYIHRIFLENGAECAVFIYPNHKSNGNGITALLASSGIDKVLPVRSQPLREIRQVELLSFLQNIKDERRMYFAKLLDGTFVYNIIQADPETIKELHKHLVNYVFFLDTNILYALLDLQAERRTTTVEKAFNISKTFGINFVTSLRTVDEMSKSIEIKGRELLNSPDIRRDLAQEGANLSEEENFTTAYWRSYAKTGITKEDFIEKFRHLPELLKLKGISIVDDLPDVPETELDKEKDLLTRTIAGHKTENIAGHDAYHRLLIKKLREAATVENSPKEYWFLSLDAQLALYAQKTRREGEKPFMYMPHQLLQILRLFEKRTPDYDATFIELFARPQIKLAQNVLPNDLAQKILSKISGYADLPKELALRIIVDQKFLSTLSSEKNTDAQNAMIEEKVELELTTQVNELAERVSLLETEKLATLQEKERAEEAERKTSRALGSRSQETKLLKTALLIVSLIAELLVACLIYFLWWNNLSLIPRIALVLVGIAVFLGILKIKWDVGVSFPHVGTAVGLLLFVFGLAAYNLPVAKDSPVKSSVTLSPASRAVASTTSTSFSK